MGACPAIRAVVLPPEVSTDDLRRLIYTSHVVAPLTAAHLTALLDAGRERNRRAGITGLMSHHGGDFLHCLEGPTAAVAAVLGSLLRDRRHRDVVVRVNEPMGGRAFAGWYMAYAELSTPAWQALRGARWTRANDADGEAEGILLLQSLWAELRQQPRSGADPGPPGF